MMMLYIVSVLFKQKTAYEMRIIDWSSDVCSSDLVAAVLSEEDVTTVQTALNSIRSVLPFLVTLSGQERRELAKMGPKSVGFDEKCATYMNNRPEFAPGFVSIAEVQKVRALRAQMPRRSEERREGKEWVSKCRVRWWPYN